MLTEFEKGSFPVCPSTRIKLTSSFIEPTPLVLPDSEDETQVGDQEKQQEQEPKEKLDTVTTVQSLLRRAQKLIHSNPDDVTNWISLTLAVAYQVWLSPERQNEAPYLSVLVKLLCNMIERTKVLLNNIEI